MSFRIGEIAIIQNATYNPRFNGVETTVLAVGHPCRRPDGSISYGYKVDIVDDRGIPFVAMPHQLRKRRPPATDESHQAMLDCIERAKRGQEVPA